LAVVVVSLAGVITWQLRPRPTGAVALPVPGEGHDVVVEVFNATGVDGLARTATRRLRTEGIDVVFYGSARDSTLDSTQIIVRRGDTTAAVVVRDALGTGVIVIQPDAKRLVDVTVLLHVDAALVLGLHP